MNQYWVCDACLSLNEERASVCYKCHVKRGLALPKPIIPGATPPPSASAAYGPGPGAPPGPDLVMAAVVGGLVTAIVTAIWVLLAERAPVLSVVGFIRFTWWTGIAVGVTVGFAGTYAGQRRSLSLALVATGLAAVSMIAGTYELVSIVLALESGRAVGTFVPPAPLDEVVGRLRLALSIDPVLLPGVWLLSPAAAWIVSVRRLVGPAPGTRDP